MVWIKICGITNNDDAEAAVRCGADALGFIFSTDSPRRISLEAALSIIDYLQDKSVIKSREITDDRDSKIGAVEKVGVFVNEDLRKVISFSRKLKLDRIQLSGDESIDHIKKLKKVIPDIKVIKAIRIGSGDRNNPEQLENTIKEFKVFADNILMDSYHPSKYGGTGKLIDMETAMIFGSLPGFILSGGFDHLNIGEAIINIRPFGIDVSTRLESSPGKKDHQLVKSFIDAARSAAET